MRSLLVLVLLAALAAGGFLSKPTINTHKAKAHDAFETKRQAQAGIKTISFDAATTAAYRKMAYDSAWAGVIKLSPQHGPQMQKLFTKK